MPRFKPEPPPELPVETSPTEGALSPREDLSRAIDQFAAIEFKTRLTRRAQELHSQIATLVNAADPFIALGVLRLIEVQLVEAVLKES